MVEQELIKARVHLTWCYRRYVRQIDSDVYVLYEHSQLATSWNDARVLELHRREDIQKVVLHQCQLGQQTDEGAPFKKPTSFTSNTPELLAALNRRCFGKQ